MLTAGCTGQGPILFELDYCHSNVMECLQVAAPTNSDCASALQLRQWLPRGSLVFDSTPRYYAFTYDEYAEVIWLSRPDLFGGGALHVDVVDGCGVDAVTYDNWDFKLCYEDAHHLVGLAYGAVYYLRVSGWDPGAQWAHLH